MANSNSVCVVNVYFSFLFVAVRCFCSRFVVYDCVVHWRLHCWPIYIFFFCSIRSSARCMRTSFLRYSPCTFLFIDFFMHTSSIAPSHGHSHSEIHDTQQQQRRRRLTVLWHLKRNKPNQQFIGCVSKNLLGFVFVLLCYFFFFRIIFFVFLCCAYHQYSVSSGYAISNDTWAQWTKNIVRLVFLSLVTANGRILYEFTCLMFLLVSLLLIYSQRARQILRLW